MSYQVEITPFAQRQIKKLSPEIPLVSPSPNAPCPMPYAHFPTNQTH
jgi:hypothetical protein